MSSGLLPGSYQSNRIVNSQIKPLAVCKKLYVGLLMINLS